MIIAPTAPPAAASAVVTKTKETPLASALNTEPPLKPNQPSQSKKTPIVAKRHTRAKNWLNSVFRIFTSRGPRIITHASAANPPNA